MFKRSQDQSHQDLKLILSCYESLEFVVSESQEGHIGPPQLEFTFESKMAD